VEFEESFVSLAGHIYSSTTIFLCADQVIQSLHNLGLRIKSNYPCQESVSSHVTQALSFVLDDIRTDCRGAAVMSSLAGGCWQCVVCDSLRRCKQTHLFQKQIIDSPCRPTEQLITGSPHSREQYAGKRGCRGISKQIMDSRWFATSGRLIYYIVFVANNRWTLLAIMRCIENGGL
jgi:hypothetical protein